MMKMMHHRSIKNGFVPSKPLLAVGRLVLFSDNVGGGGGGGVSSPSAAMPMPMPMGSSSSSSRRLLYLHAGGEEGGRGAAFMVKRLYSEVPDHLPILQCTGRKRLGGGFVPHQCNMLLLLPSFAFARRRALASTSTSQSSSQEPPPTTTTKEEEEECQTISSTSKLQRATDADDDDELSNSTNVSLNQFPGLLASIRWARPYMTFGESLSFCSTQYMLRLNPVTSYFEEQQDVAPATLPVPSSSFCCGSAYGWLFLTDHDLGMRLYNPFSGAEIQLPPVRKLPPDVKHRSLNEWVVHKAVFSANPSFEPRPVVLVIYGGQPTTRLAFCKPGDERWTPLEFSPSHTHWDAIYHKGQFYVLSHPGYVAALDIGRLIDDDDHSVKTTLVATPSKRGGKKKVRLSYLVVVDGELVKVELRRRCFQGCCIEQSMKAIEIERKRDGDTSDEEDYSSGERKRDGDTSDEEEEDYYSGDDEEVGKEFERNGGTTIDDGNLHFLDWEDGFEDDGELRAIYPHRVLCPSTYGVKIRRLDVKSEKQWVKVESLGGKAVFVGYNTSFALSASDYPAGVCIPDNIYFTYGYGGGPFTERLTYDMGIYNLKDESVKPLLPPTPISGEHMVAPIWIVNAVI